MKIAVTSQNFKTVTGHAGKSRRFVVYDTGPAPQEIGRLDLPKEMSMHEFQGGPHPLDEMDVLITGSAGQGFIKNLANRGVLVVVTGETDPLQAIADFIGGRVKPPLPHEHHHHGHP